MAGKAITRASNRVARVIDHLSKNTLADLLLDPPKSANTPRTNRFSPIFNRN